MSKFLSVGWFKSKIEKSVEKVISEKIENIITKIDEDVDEDEYILNKAEKYSEKSIYTKQPYKNVTLVNDVLTIVLDDGDIIQKPDSSEEDFNNVKHCKTVQDLMDFVKDPEIVKKQQEMDEENERISVLQAGLNSLKDLNDFDVRDNSLYLEGTTRSIPQLLVERFIEIVDTNKYYSGFGNLEKNLKDCSEYQALLKFWMKCCLNPNAQSAEDLYTFLSHHNFKIDRHGNFYAYRRVVSLNNENKELVEFISNAYNKVKAIWKKKPKKFNITQNIKDSSYSLTKRDNLLGRDKIIGNLKDLYLNLPEMKSNSYTSSHTGKEDYKIGSIISMPRYEGNDNNSVSCSKGFHAASKAYDYSYFGDTPILVIINPMDVLAVPMNEVGKLRTCRWFFAMTLTEEEQFILDEEDFDVTELGDVFEEKCLLNLTEHVKTGFAEEVKRHTFQIPHITYSEINKLVIDLNKLNEEIINRIHLI